MWRNNYRKAVQLIGDGTINVGALLTEPFKLEDAAAAIEHVSAGKGIKTAVVPSWVEQDVDTGRPYLLDGARFSHESRNRLRS